MDDTALIDVTIDSAVLLDKSGRITHWSTGATSHFGYSKKDVLGRSINLLYDRNYPFPKLIQETQTLQKTWQKETIFIQKNGSRGACLTSLYPLPFTDQNKINALLIHQNISPQLKNEELTKKSALTRTQLLHSISDVWSIHFLLMDTLHSLEQTEQKLRESELRFHLLAQNAKDVISRHTPDGTYLYVSPASKNSIGYSPENLVGKNIFKLLHHDDQAKIRKLFTRRRDDLHNKPVIYRIKRKEGEFRWFESNVRLIFDENSRMIKEIQLASRDVTDRVLDKKARLRGQQLAHVFRLSTMEEMASGMAHEISQPLAAIVNFTRGCVRHLQNNDYDANELKAIMEKAAAQAERAGEIVQRLKNFFCKGQLIKTSCKINNVIRETVSFMKLELTASQTKIDFMFDKNVPVILMDKIQIQQVLLNLIQNAIEAMQEHHIKIKRIRIQTEASNADFIDITISDSGLGFPKDLINKVFMPFFTTKAHGRGMGLAICRSIIEAHGGLFTIHPNSNNSQSWIRFSLPTPI